MGVEVFGTEMLTDQFTVGGISEEVAQRRVSVEAFEKMEQP